MNKPDLKKIFQIVFILVFVMLLFTPFLGVFSPKRVSAIEDDKGFSVYHSLFKKDGSINKKWIYYFERYFNYQFSFRDELIRLNKRVRYFLGGNITKYSSYYYHKDTDWFFTYKIEPVVNEVNLKEISATIKEIVDYCNQNNIKLYVIAVPSKEKVYIENTFIYNTTEYDFKKIYEVFQKFGINIIYPYESMKKSKEYVFFKHDHHWTDMGAYLGYVELLKVIQRDFSDVKITPLSDFDIVWHNKPRSDFSHKFLPETYFTRQLIDSYQYKEKYKFLNYKYQDKISITTEPEKEVKIFYNPDKKHNILLVGSSLSENLSYFLATSFKNIYKDRINSPYFEDTKIYLEKILPEIEQAKPDIIIINDVTFNFLNDFLPKYRGGRK